MALVKFELVFETIVGIRKHMAMRLEREISSAIFHYGLTMRVAWPPYCGLTIYGKKCCSPVIQLDYHYKKKK